MKISGIYKITNKVNGKYYVGSSADILGMPHGRWHQHRAHLKCQRHYNKHLQCAWNKYGKDNFDWIIIERIPENNLLVVEQKYLNVAKQEKEKTYNQSFVAGRPEWTNESRKRRSELISGKNNPNYGNGNKIKGRKNYFYGKHHSIESRKKMSKSRMGENNSSYNPTTHTFYNENTKETFRGTRLKFCNSFNVLSCGVSTIIHNPNKSHRGWKLLIPLKTIVGVNAGRIWDAKAS